MRTIYAVFLIVAGSTIFSYASIPFESPSNSGAVVLENGVPASLRSSNAVPLSLTDFQRLVTHDILGPD